MEHDEGDVNTALMVDGNAVAGKLQQIFGRDMTTTVVRCGGCASVAQIGALIAFTRGPGVVLRCLSCRAVIARLVETPTAIYLDARGAAYLRMEAAPATRR